MISESQQAIWCPRLLAVARIMLGLLYMQHGLSKYFGFPGAQPPGFTMISLVGLAGLLEIVGGLMLIVGFYVRATAFVLAGQMAVAYFFVANRTARGFYPLVNGGQLEVVYCFFFLALVAVGGGTWSLDEKQKRR